MTHDMRTRRSMVSGLGAAVAALAVGSRTATAQTAAGQFQPARHAQDAWLDAVPGKHRTFIDAATPRGAGEAVLYANNLYESNKSGYSLPEKDIVVVACYRHFATPFAFTDAMWAKYGKAFSMVIEFTDPKTKQAPSTNVRHAVRGLRPGDALLCRAARDDDERQRRRDLQGADRQPDPEQLHGGRRRARGESRAGVRLHAAQHALIALRSFTSRKSRASTT